MTEQTARPSILVFDVNETLLDITVLEPFFERLFGDRQAMRQWFAEMVLYSEAITLADQYVAFGQLGVGVLRMLAAIKNVNLSDADVEAFQSTVRSFPVHPDVEPALGRLKAAGFRLVTLTNSSAEAQAEKLGQAGLAAYFERQFSVEEVGRFKPAPKTYHLVADALGVATIDLGMIAAHIWDTLGAQAAGCAGVFVARTGNAPLPIEGLPQPDIAAPDLAEAASLMIERWR